MGAAEEMEAGRKRSEYFANPTTSHPQPKTEPIREGNGAVPVNIDIVAAAPGNQRQAEGAKCEMPPSERPSEQKVLANAATMAEPPSVVEFFSRVLVWHTPETPGFCHIAWRNPKFDHGFSGKAYTRLIDFMAGRDWLVAHPSVAKDIWFATGQQREAGDTDKSRALRSRANTAMMKSIFLDVDVKDPPKGYANLTEALDALAEFCKTVRIPFPSAIVASGSGLQPYWISDRPLSVEEWRPYADGLRAMAAQHGLRCDGSVTIDCARVLRVPGTINNKTDPGRPVKLLGLAKADITFDAKIGHIRGVIQPSVPTPASTPKHNWVAALEPETPDAELKATAPLGTPTEYPPVKLGPVLKKCPYFKDAVRTGGTGADQGLWMMTVLATTFVEKGHVWTAPAVQEESDYLRSVRVQPCIRPVFEWRTDLHCDAAAMAAGPDVIR
jgi:hypothetical protein